MRVVACRDALAHDDPRIVDRLGDRKNGEPARAHVAHLIEIKHLAVDRDKRVDRAIPHRREPDDHPWRVDPERAALISSQRSEIDPRFIRAQEGMVSVRLGNIGRAHDVGGVRAVGRAARAAERAEVLYFALLILERVERPIRRQGRADDDPGRIDAISRACLAAQGSQIPDRVIKLSLGTGQTGEESESDREKDSCFHE